MFYIQCYIQGANVKEIYLKLKFTINYVIRFTELISLKEELIKIKKTPHD